MKVKECMNDNVCHVTPESKIFEVAKLMCGNHIGCIPVCNSQNKVVGVVTDRDLIIRGIACDKDVKQTPISEVMTCDVCCCSPEEEVNAAQKKMSEMQIRRIPVVENDKIVGILTLGNLAQEDVKTEDVYNTLEQICCCGKNQKNAE